MNEVKGKAKSLFAISGRRFHVPSFLYVDQTSLSEALRTIPGLESRRQKCAMNVDEDELRTIRHHLSQSPAPAPLKTRLSTLLQKNRNKKWIVRTSFGVKENQDEFDSSCFSYEVVSAASAHDLGCAVMRVSSSIFEPRSWTHLLATGQNPASCELGVIVQEFVQGTIFGTAYSDYTFWSHGNPSSNLTKDVKLERQNFDGVPSNELTSFWRQLKQGMRVLERRFKSAVRADWIFDGQQLWWLQVSAVTAKTGVLSEHSLAIINSNPSNIASCFPRVKTLMGWSLLEETLEHSRKAIFKLTGMSGDKANETERIFKGSYRERFAFRTFVQILVLGFFHSMRLLPTLLGARRAQFRARLLHRVFLNKVSKSILERWQSELATHVAAIGNFEIEVTSLKQCLSTLAGLRLRQMAYFETFASLLSLEALNRKLVSTARRQEEANHAEKTSLECVDLDQMLKNAASLGDAADKQCRQASIYREKMQNLLDSIASLLIVHGVIEESSDLYHLSVAELQAYLERSDFTLKHLVNERKRHQTNHMLENADESFVNTTFEVQAPWGESKSRERPGRKVFFAEDCVVTNAV